MIQLIDVYSSCVAFTRERDVRSLNGGDRGDTITKKSVARCSYPWCASIRDSVGGRLAGFTPTPPPPFISRRGPVCDNMPRASDECQWSWIRSFPHMHMNVCVAFGNSRIPLFCPTLVCAVRAADFIHMPSLRSRHCRYATLLFHGIVCPPRIARVSMNASPANE